jgi:AcrR family transcriptional regulator
MARISKEQQEQIRNNIVETSRQLFIDEGYGQTSTKKIAKAVGIAEGTVFNYFKTKSDILIEVVASDLSSEVYNGPTLSMDADAVDVFIDYYRKMCSPFLKLPKKIMLDIFMTILKAAKTAPTMMSKFASLDFKFIDVMEDMVMKLQEKNMLAPCDPRLLAESLYSDVMYGFMIYLYEKDISLDECFQMIDNKFKFTLTPFIKKEKNNA